MSYKLSYLNEGYVIEEELNSTTVIPAPPSLPPPSQTPQIKTQKSLPRQRELDFSDEQDLKVIISIIEKQYNTKTAKDLKMLHLALKNIKLFAELENEIPLNQMYNLFKELNYSIFPTRKVVFHQGEIGKEFYIILKGSVFIIGNEDQKKADKNEEQQNEPDLKKKESLPRKSIQFSPYQNNNSTNQRRLSRMSVVPYLKKPQTLLSSPKDENTLSGAHKSVILSVPSQVPHSRHPSFSTSRRPSFMNQEELTDKEYIKRQFPHLDILALLEAGASFGEVALRDSVPRTATVICSGETHFITLKRDAFRKFLDGYYELVQRQNISFIKEVSIFKKWTDQMINQMFFFFEKKNVRMNQIIFREGSESDGVYLIREGEIKIFQGVSLAYQQEDKLKSIRHFMRNQDVHKLASFQAPVSHLGVGQMFGCDEIVANTTRKHTAVCSSSSCSLFFLNKEKFLQFSKRRNTFENAIEESNLKQEYHQQMIGHLESFTKNQHEYFKKKEREARNQSQSPSQKNKNQGFEEYPSPSFQKGQTQPIFFNAPQSYIQSKNLFESLPEKFLLDLSMKEEGNGTLKRRDSTHKFKLISQGGIFANRSLRNIPENMNIQGEDKINSILKSDSFINLNGIPNSCMSRQSKQGATDQTINNTTNILTNNNYHSQSQPYLSGPQQEESYIINLNNESSLLQDMKEQSSQSDLLNTKKINLIPISLSKKCLFKKDRKNNLDGYPTIRNKSLEDNRLAKVMEDRLHVSLQMHQIFQQVKDSNFKKLLDESCVHKLDLENQMIEVCQNDITFKKRVENHYPQIMSYDSHNSQSSLILKVPKKRQNIKERIMKSLKLPSLLQADNQTLMNVFPLTTTTDSRNSRLNKFQSSKNLISNAQTSKYYSTININSAQQSTGSPFLLTQEDSLIQLHSPKVKEQEEEKKLNQSNDNSKEKENLLIIDTRKQDGSEDKRKQVNFNQWKSQKINFKNLILDNKVIINSKINSSIKNIKSIDMIVNSDKIILTPKPFNYEQLSTKDKFVNAQLQYFKSKSNSSVNISSQQSKQLNI